MDGQEECLVRTASLSNRRHGEDASVAEAQERRQRVPSPDCIGERRLEVSGEFGCC